MVEHHQFNLVLAHHLGQLIRLAGTDKQSAMRPLALGLLDLHQLAAGGRHQFNGFLQRRLKIAFTGFVGTAEIGGEHHAHQHHALGLA